MSTAASPSVTPGDVLESALADLLYGRNTEAARAVLTGADPAFRAEGLDASAAEVRRMVRTRAHRGSGSIETWFPRTLGTWRTEHPGDADLDALLTRFCATPECASWTELPTGDAGVSLEEAFYRFLVRAGVGDAIVREEEFLAAMAKAMVVAPRARFRRPAEFVDVPGGCGAVSQSGEVHAVVDGKYVRGTLPRP